MILDLPVSAGLARAAARRGENEAVDRFEREGLAFHETLRQSFLAIARAEPGRCAVIDAGAGEDEVAEAIWNVTRERFRALLEPKTPA